MTVRSVDASALSAKDKDTVGGNSVYRFGYFVDGKKINGFGHDLKIEVNYELMPGDNPKQAAVYYLDGNGELQTVQNVVYDAATGKIAFYPGNNF